MRRLALMVFACLAFTLLYLGSPPKVSAAVPSWVQEGVTATYDGYSGAPAAGGGYQQVGAVVVIYTNTVTDVSATTISGSLGSQEVTTGISLQYPWSKSTGEALGQFWVDLTNLNGLRGPFGESIPLTGQQDFSYGGNTWQDAYVFAYSNPQTGVEYHVIADSKTGLMLAYAELYPSRQTYLYFTSINVDLSGYQPPVQQQATTLVITPATFTLEPGAATTLTVKLTSGDNPVAGKTITWGTTAGSLSATSTTTDSFGEVTITYTAPTATAQVTITATFAGDTQYQSGSCSSSGTVATTAVAQPAAALVENISTHVGEVISVGENGVASVTVQSTQAVVVNFEEAQPVKTISVTTSVAIEKISVQSQQLAQKPAAIPEPTAAVPGLVVSHYLEITVTPTAATAVQVENAVIEFKVQKSWLSGNNIDPATVKLLKYENGQWVELPTTATGAEDATYKYYSATTSGFSTFAVAGKTAPSALTLILLTAVVAVVAIGIVIAVVKLRSR